MAGTALILGILVLLVWPRVSVLTVTQYVGLDPKGVGLKEVLGESYLVRTTQAHIDAHSLLDRDKGIWALLPPAWSLLVYYFLQWESLAERRRCHVEMQD